MLYTAKCFWPGVTEEELRLAAARIKEGGEDAVGFRGAVLLPHDELVLCLFDAPSQHGVRRASERAGMPCERVMETVWIGPRRSRSDPTSPTTRGEE